MNILTLETTCDETAAAVVENGRLQALSCTRLLGSEESSGHLGDIILGRVVSIYIEDRFVDAEGPYVRAEDLHSIGRMNGLGNYVRTRDAFITIPRISLKDWTNEHR